MPKLFGTNGIRGSARKLFTREFCIKIGQVFGSWLKTNGKSGWMAVAMDPRDSSPFIKAGICQGLAALGFEILDEGVIPTPALTYFVKKNPHIAGGIMITGSHIKADLNGVKLLVDGEEVNKVQEQQIEELFTQQYPFSGGNPVIRQENAARDLYIDMLVDMADVPYPNLKIVIDSAHGTQTEIVPELFSRLGLKIVFDGDIQSDYFVPRDTEDSNSVSELSKKVLQQSADLGIAYDADGDRVVFVDADGEFVPGDYSCTLISKNYQGPIVTTVSASDVVDSLDNQVIRTRVGATHVIDQMRKNRSQFGFEPNGGGIFADHFYGRDGGATTIAMLNILKKSRVGLTETLACLPKYYLFKDKIDCPFDKYDLVKSAVREKFSSKDIDETDGLKVFLDTHEWVLFRGSGNAPEFRVFVQSASEPKAKSLGQKYLDWVSQLVQIGAVKTHAKLPGFDSLGIEKSIDVLPDQIDQTILEMSTVHIGPGLGLVDNIVLAGMGGSALGGRIVAGLKNMVHLPFEVVTGFELPRYVNEKTLLILSSYSGNTAEVLACAASGMALGARMFAIDTDGKLAEMAKSNNMDSFLFDPKFDPSGMPRMGVGYSIFAVLILLLRLGLIETPPDLNNLAAWLRSQQQVIKKSAKNLAGELFEKHPVFLAGAHLIAAAHVTKNNLNENAKQIAYLFDLPEADHHLLEGLSFPSSLTTDTIFILFRSGLYSKSLDDQILVTAEVINKRRFKLIEIQAIGETSLQQILYFVHLGQYLSLYLAQLSGIDPGPIPWVDYIKDKLK